MEFLHTLALLTKLIFISLPILIKLFTKHLRLGQRWCYSVFFFSVSVVSPNACRQVWGQGTSCGRFLNCIPITGWGGWRWIKFESWRLRNSKLSTSHTHSWSFQSNSFQIYKSEIWKELGSKVSLCLWTYSSAWYTNLMYYEFHFQKKSPQYRILLQRVWVEYYFTLYICPGDGKKTC